MGRGTWLPETSGIVRLDHIFCNLGGKGGRRGRRLLQYKTVEVEQYFTRRCLGQGDWVHGREGAPHRLFRGTLGAGPPRPLKLQHNTHRDTTTRGQV